jgi:hypothetical protein
MDLLSRDSLAAFDPIAVMTLLCGREQAARLAARELVILRCSAPPREVNTDSKLAIAEYRAARLQLLEWFITQQGLPVRALIDPPHQTDETCETYCPVCGAQFRLSEGVCPDCPDVLLQPLGDPSASARLALSAATSRILTSQTSVTTPPSSCIPYLKGQHHHEQQNG